MFRFPLEPVDSGDQVSVAEQQGTGLHSAMRTPEPVSMLSRRLGRYEVLDRLAMGGMAEVLLATHGEILGFRTLVVLKKVLPHLAQNPQFIAMFLDEARIAAMLDHPNVARIIEVGKSGHEYFLAMELVQGKSLLGLQRRAIELDEPIDPKIAALIIAQTAAGLHHAHRLGDATGRPMGLVHRDVSPHNILVSFEGSVKVIDFGIARALGRLGATSGGGLKGKIGYMSPEQARGEDVDHRTDIWALGVVLWETICGCRLFSGDTEFATMRKLLEGPIPRPSSLVPNLSGTLDDIVMRALSREPAGRFQSAEEMSGALEKYIVQAGGVSTTELAALMTFFFFGEEQVKWKATVRMVLDSPPTLDSVEPLPASVVPLRSLPPQKPHARVAMLILGALGMAAVGAFLLWVFTPPVPLPVTTLPTATQPKGILIEPLPSPVTTPPAATVPGPGDTSAATSTARPAPGRNTRKRQHAPNARRVPADRRPNPF